MSNATPVTAPVDPAAAADPAIASVGLTRSDFMMLTKARLSALVVVTTAAGYALSTGTAGIGWGMLNTLIGTTATAFGSGCFNQLMEMEPDAKMLRTADRPLPGGRVPPVAAFVLGWLLCAFGLIHLGVRVNTEASALALLTLITYLFIYTPMKQRSTLNTLVGAVSGAIPPVIGWAAAAGAHGVQKGLLRWELFVQPQALFLFSLLFLWQLPHFLAINWMYRAEYMRGGFVMWSNDDPTGKKTANLALAWTLPMLGLAVWPPLAGFTSWWFAVPTLAATCWLLKLGLVFRRTGERADARKLFFATLIYLPVVLAALLLARR
jgi:protoheme IX farnesyltransferase